MIHLTREVRFNLLPGHSQRPVTNSWGGWPTATALSPHLVFRCQLAGELETDSGYLCNIKLIDDALRNKVIRPCCESPPPETAEALIQFAFQAIQGAFPDNCRIEKLTLGVTPFLEYSIHSKNETMIQITQQFEFSASHRLHNPALSVEENLRVFGKCNNPHGHGHNYLLKVTLEGTPDEQKPVVSLEGFESLVRSQVIDELDHKNLNVEVAAFQSLNPSVENIAMVIWRMLEPALVDLDDGQLRLACVRVYETPKTWADYFGDR